MTGELWTLFIWHQDIRVSHFQSSALSFIFTQYSFCNSFRNALLHGSATQQAKQSHAVLERLPPSPAPAGPLLLGSAVPLRKFKVGCGYIPSAMKLSFTPLESRGKYRASEIGQARMPGNRPGATVLASQLRSLIFD